MPALEEINKSDGDRRFFFICVVFGILSIFVLRNLSSEAEEQFTVFDWLAVGTGVMVIVIYSLYVFNPNLRSTISLDRAGDNAYYMGLLFTLSSLAFSLYKISSGSNIEASRVISLLPDFGIALFCTIVGITARIALQQYGDDNYAESIARDELSVAVGKFRQNLVQANHSMHKLNSAMQHSATHVLEQMRTVRSDNEQTMRAMQSSARELTSEVSRQLSALTQVSKSAGREIEQHSRHLNAQLNSLKLDPKIYLAMEKLGTTLDKLNARYVETSDVHVKTTIAAKVALTQLKSLDKQGEITLKDLRRATKRSLSASSAYNDMLEQASKDIRKKSQRRATKSLK